MAKPRADQLLVDRGLAESRAKAQALILAGLVFSGERKIDKAGQALAARCAAGGARQGPSLGVARRDQARACARPFRLGRDRRGGARRRRLDRRLHRRAAAARRGEGVRGRCRHQPARLEAAPGSARGRPRADQRPLSRPTTIVTEPVDLIVCDASFIALAKVLDTALDFARPGGRLVALVKPQFEAERDEIGKGGVVRDPAVHERVCAAAADWVERARLARRRGRRRARSPAPKAMSSSCSRREKTQCDKAVATSRH